MCFLFCTCIKSHIRLRVTEATAKQGKVQPEAFRQAAPVLLDAGTSKGSNSQDVGRCDSAPCSYEVLQSGQVQGKERVKRPTNKQRRQSLTLLLPLVPVKSEEMWSSPLSTHNSADFSGIASTCKRHVFGSLGFKSIQLIQLYILVTGQWVI